MLTVYGDRSTTTCAGRTRRELLQIGAFSLGSLAVSAVPRTKGFASEAAKILKDKAVVVLNMQGGPTQFETFDPNMQAPREYRAMFGEVATKLPGITFGSHFPELARLADRMAVVRSYRHGISGHGEAAMHVAAGGNPTGATLGTLYSVIAGITNPTTGMPNNTVVIPGAIDEAYRPFTSPTRVTSNGSLPDIYKAFDPSSGGTIVENMKLQIPEQRLGDRRMLLSQLDTLRRELDGTGALDAANSFQQQAFDVISGGLSEAFDLSLEDPRLVARYDTSRFKVPQAAIDKRPRKLVKNHSPIALGKQMLLARRLVEAGCGYVTVATPGWDMHGAHEYEIADGMPVLGPAVDRAVSAFIEDLHDRGLSEKVLLVMTGEFGRTPRINDKRGRDHWGNLCPLVFVGGGLQMGQVIGRSDKQGGEPAGDAISSANMLATIMGTLIDVGLLRTLSSVPRDVVNAITLCEPIAQLV